MNISATVGSVSLRNPIILASGVVAAGKEYSQLINYSKIGGIVTKTITLNEKIGNKPPRLWETKSSLLNSIGLENKGFDVFVESNYSFLKNIDCKVIVSFAGASEEDFLALAAKCNSLDFAAALEANLSCPNVERGSYGTSPEICFEIVGKLRKVVSDKPLWIKLSPQVADIGAIAKAAEKAGADAISAVNTVPAIEIDPNTLAPRIGNITGGLCGEAIRPIALKAVFEIAKAVEIPIVGIGGISEPEDVVKFLALGASAVQIGSALFNKPNLPEMAVRYLPDYLLRNGYGSLDDLIGDFWRRNNLER